MKGVIIQVLVGAALLTLAVCVYISVLIGKANRR